MGIFAESKDHHPEWKLTNGGRNVEVRLTSHFANNKVTLFDFELAEAMNRANKRAAKFNAYPRIENSQFLAAAVAVGSVAIIFAGYTYFVGTRDIRFHYKYLWQGTPAPLNQLKGESAENHSVFRTEPPIHTQNKFISFI